MPRPVGSDAPDTAQAIELTAGAIERRTNGDVRAWSLEAAQTEARRLAVMLDGGTDPRVLERTQAADKQAQAAAVLESDGQAAMTLGEVWRACSAARKPYWEERQYQDQLTLGDAGGVKPQRGKPDTLRGLRR